MKLILSALNFVILCRDINISDWEEYKVLRAVEKFAGLYADDLRPFLLEHTFIRALQWRDKRK